MMQSDVSAYEVKSKRNNDRDAVFGMEERYSEPFSPATVQEITHTRLPIRRSISEFDPHAVLSGSRIACPMKRDLQEGNLMTVRVP